ncbi:hypothetical protein [Yersinia frederiksenii]|uniref:hypothetical protein n=1 Tax=Yersinia frederiksenii TaxID=29484 RepID=UPI0005E05B05|nr:hypothetical protein [Yersinia frederiksenii]CQH37992.1 Uncharacterised protein [Yersinia frederiksenii]
MTGMLTSPELEMVSRKTCEINIGKTNIEAEILHPEQVVIRDARKTYDVGILCYKQRYMFNPKESDQKKGLIADKRKVVLGSFDGTRTDIVKAAIWAVLAGNMRAQDVRYLVRFIDFIDREYKYPTISHVDMIDAYITYTQYLFDQINHSNVTKPKKSARQIASISQRYAAFVASLKTGLDLEQVKSTTFTIRLRNSSETQPSIRTQLITQDKVFAVHLKIFSTLAEFVIGQKNFPLVIKENKTLGLNQVIYFTRDTHSGNNFRTADKTEWPRFVYTENGMLSWIEARTLASKHGVHLGLAKGREYQRFHEQLREYNKKNRTHSRKYYRILANAAVRHFVHAMIADTNCNPSVLFEAPMQEERPLKGVGKTRLMSIKGRAGYDKQSIDITNRFLPYYRQYLRLRDWMLGPTNTNEKLIITFQKRGPDISPHIEFSNWRADCLKSPFFPDTLPYINLRDYRKGGSYHYLSITDGDIGYAATMLGNSPDTARKHYAYKQLEDSATELHQFFEQFRKACSVKATEATIPVRVVKNAPKINTGRCTGSLDDEPVLIEGFTADAPELDCNTPIACFFCEHYGIHADETDLTRLLSVREFITVQSQSKSRNMNEHYIKFEPIIERISEIIEQFETTQLNAKEIVQAARDNVINGQLDPYWGARINALIDGGML